MNQLFIGALDLSAYLTQANLDNSARWLITCWNVPEEKCAGLFCNPITLVPVFFHWRNYNHSRIGDYSGFPKSIVYASFLDLEIAPYAEINFTFSVGYRSFVEFHIKTRLYLALGEEQ